MGYELICSGISQVFGIFFDAFIQGFLYFNFWHNTTSVFAFLLSSSDLFFAYHNSQYSIFIKWPSADSVSMPGLCKTKYLAVLIFRLFYSELMQYCRSNINDGRFFFQLFSNCRKGRREQVSDLFRDLRSSFLYFLRRRYPLFCLLPSSRKPCTPIRSRPNIGGFAHIRSFESLLRQINVSNRLFFPPFGGAMANNFSLISRCKVNFSFPGATIPYFVSTFQIEKNAGQAVCERDGFQPIHVGIPD